MKISIIIIFLLASANIYAKSHGNLGEYIKKCNKQEKKAQNKLEDHFQKNDASIEPITIPRNEVQENIHNGTQDNFYDVNNSESYSRL